MVQAFCRGKCLLDAFYFVLNSIDTLDGANNALGRLAADFTQRYLEEVVYPREVQLGAEVGTAQDEQEGNELLKFFDVSIAEEVARYLLLVIIPRLADDAVAFRHLLKPGLIISPLFV